MENKTSKYTTDGKKVVVIGNLNSQEKIVQEVFVSGDSELPQGEHFVVKTLLDAPAVSWKEKSLADIERNYAEKERYYKTEMDRLRKAYETEQAILRDKIAYTKKAINGLCEEPFNHVARFLLSEFKFYVIGSYLPKIVGAEEMESIPGYCKNLRLITLFGQDDGTLSWGINRYSDGSGHNTVIYPFCTKEEAEEKVKEIITQTIDSSKEYSIETVKQAKEYGVPLDKEKLAALKEREILNVKKAIDADKENNKKRNEKIKELESL